MTNISEYIYTIVAVIITAILIMSLDTIKITPTKTAPVFEVDNRNYIHMKNNEQNKKFIKELMELYGE